MCRILNERLGVKRLEVERLEVERLEVERLEVERLEVKGLGLKVHQKNLGLPASNETVSFLPGV
jgi:hypothetical protein